MDEQIAVPAEAVYLSVEKEYFGLDLVIMPSIE